MAPSLRLMVVGIGPAPPSGGSAPLASGSALLPPLHALKKLSPLHVVTKDGGEVGRLSKNAVHLPHISVSKVRDGAVSYATIMRAVTDAVSTGVHSITSQYSLQ